MNKKILASLILIGLLGAAAGIGTYAWFSSTRERNPGFYTAHLDLELNERYDWGDYKILDNMAPGEDRVQIFDLKGHGTTASYSELEISYEAPCLCVGDGTKDWAEVSIPVDIALQDITQLSFWKKVVSYGASGWNPNVYLCVDANGNGVFESDVAGYHRSTVGGATPEAAAAKYVAPDAFIALETPVGLTAYDLDFALVPAFSMSAWAVDANGEVSYDYGAGLAQFATNSFGEINPTDRVKFIKIVIGGSGNWMDEVAYVKDISLNGGLLPLPDIGEVITVTVTDQEGTTVTRSLKNWVGKKMKILDNRDGVGWVKVTLHFKESASNEYQSICGNIDFTFTLWQGP